MGTMYNSYRTISGSRGIVVPITRLRSAPIGAAFSGRSVPISLLRRVRRLNT
jgi:hypothetical protein